ncbi:hypothetical protein RAD15_24310 [Bradyrhizobium sp. 14AA]
MYRALMLSCGLILMSATLASADDILCPTQKEPSCQDILPAQPERCDRNFCNVAKSSSGGRTACLWSCAAHFEGLTVNGVPVQSLFDALTKSPKQ